MSSSWRRATLKDWWPDRSTGVCRMPFRPSLLRRREDIDSWKSSSECLSPVSTPLTSTCSNSTGTLSALKIVLTVSATSAPMPSPGIRVTVYFPPNLVGLKMSDWTVAYRRDCWCKEAATEPWRRDKRCMIAYRGGRWMCCGGRKYETKLKQLSELPHTTHDLGSY